MTTRRVDPAAQAPPPSRTARTVTLCGGIVVPYPVPVSPAASNIGRANRRMDTNPELLVRSALHRRGLRFRKDLLLRTPDLRVRADVVFTRWKVAVFIDGCFWHCCPDHLTIPARNQAYWLPKLQSNVDRDRRVDAELTRAGWSVVRVWEHLSPADATDEIELTVRKQRRLLESGC